MPTVVTIAAHHEGGPADQASLPETFRTYTSVDVIGGDGCALKNVIAIATGISTRLGSGQCPERDIQGLGRSPASRWHGRESTDALMGLAGLGDLADLHR